MPAYTVESLLDKPLTWINAVYKEIMREDFEEIIFQASIHGVDQAEIKSMKQRFEFEIEGKKHSEHIPSIAELQNMGLKVGKPSKTKVVR